MPEKNTDPPLYEVKKSGSMWLVLSKSSGKVQFQSLRRINCLDWIKSNDPSFNLS